MTLFFEYFEALKPENIENWMYSAIIYGMYI